MVDKEKILEHINKIEVLARRKENQWLLEELEYRFGCGEKIDSIYEYCIKKVIQEQAKEFYKDFPLKELIPGLESDFVKMESCRRKGSFDEFSMSVYQQIERITNTVCTKPKLSESVSKLMGHPAYVSSTQSKDGTWPEITFSDRKSSSLTIARVVFWKNVYEKSQKTLAEQKAVDRINCVLYFLCYQAKLKSQDFLQFKEYKETYNAIYQFRNLNHRAAQLSDGQKLVIDKIRPQQGVYYFKFMQALLFYVEGVTKGLAELDNLYDYAQNQDKKEVKPELDK